MARFGAVGGLLAVLVLGGCGITTPEMQEWYEPQEQQKFNENNLINHIKCEIRKGADAALANYTDAGKRSGFPATWFADWQAEVTLKLSVEEKGALNPGLSWVHDISELRTFTLGAGLNGSSTATRVENVSFTYPLTSLRAKGKGKGPCPPTSGMTIIGDLKIGQFIDSKIFLSTVPGTIPGPYGAFSYQVTFVAVYGGSITPTWKLVEVTANPDSPFANVSRTRTHDITISFSAPNDEAAEERSRLHNAALIGQAVASALGRTRN